MSARRFRPAWRRPAEAFGKQPTDDMSFGREAGVADLFATRSSARDRRDKKSK